MSQKNTVIIFNHGGGMRGLVPAHIMSRMEDTTGLRMADMVDIFTGPSTGAILNAALNLPNPDHPTRPLYRARHLVRFYEREGLNIFPPDRSREFRGIIHDFNNRTLKIGQLNALFSHGHYDPYNLGRPLRALYGKARLSDTLRTLIVPIYNIDSAQTAMLSESGAPLPDRGGHAVWLKHVRTGVPADAERHTPDVSLYDAVMASCAAPTYFPCHHLEIRQPGAAVAQSISAIDGGLYDNPCISWMGAIRKHVPEGSKPVMIVLGTGYTNRSVKKEDWNRYGALGVVDPANDFPLINIFFHAPESALLDSFVAEMGNNIFEFNKSMYTSRHRPAMAIDDASPENLQVLQKFHEEIIEDNRESFDELCHILVNNRDRRVEDDTRKARQSRMRYYMGVVTRKKRRGS
jgi:patatin-like phospholipase/acyl hydrolase